MLLDRDFQKALSSPAGWNSVIHTSKGIMEQMQNLNLPEMVLKTRTDSASRLHRRDPGDDPLVGRGNDDRRSKPCPCEPAKCCWGKIRARLSRTTRDDG